MVVIKNLSTNKIITQNAKIASSFLDRLLGLLNPKNPRFMIFYTRFGIHTFFMNTPIDVLILGDDKRITILKEDLKPFRLYFYNLHFSIVVEMPKNTIKKNRLHINDKISFG